MDPFTIVLLAMLAFAVLLVASIGRRPSMGEGRAPLLPRLVAGAALVGAFLSTVGGIVTIVLTFVGDAVTLAVPVITTIETVPDALRATPEASILSGESHQSFVPLAIAGLENVPPYWTLEVWPIGVGLALVVLAGLIRNGERLQRDTKGLV